MNWNAFTGGLMKWGPRIIALVQGARDKYGSAKTGEEKFQIVKKAAIGEAGSTADSGVSIAEGVAGRDLVNEQNLRDAAAQGEALVNESIQIGYDIMKKRDRLEEIERLLRDLAPPAALPPAPPAAPAAY